MNEERIVDYRRWCRSCEYYSLDETEDPCNRCLTNPANVDSRKPTEWKEKK